MAAEKKYCLFCGDPVRGRSDKKFCNDFCRNAYNNEEKKSNHKIFRIIDQFNKKNRQILKTMLGDRKTRTLTEKQLLQKGFEFGYHTHFFETNKGDTYTFCYDYGYLEQEEEKYMIVKESLPVKEIRLAK